MRRFLLSVFCAAGVQMFVVWFWVLSKQYNWPAVLDYLVAPAMVPTAFYVDGGPPKQVLVTCLVINFGVYVVACYVAIGFYGRWKRRRFEEGNGH